MSDAGDAFGYFLQEYKKRLPTNEENKDFHNHIDYMIKYFRTNHIIYQDRWGDWISPNDERYWRNPNVEEKSAIQEKHKVEETQCKSDGPKSTIVMASLFLAALGCLYSLGAVIPTVNYVAILFGLLIALQGVLTLFHELGLIPFAIWGWLY
jgi:hypothetical protein